MKNITLLNLNLGRVVFRFYLMMAVAIGLGFLGQFKLAAILGFVLAISTILGVSFKTAIKKTTKKSESQLEKAESKTMTQKAA